MLYQSLFLTIYILTIAFILGAVFGSFINCMAWRIVNHESVMRGRSHCAVCGHQLAAPDLIPIFSYIFLQGKCRYCGKKISPRYMIIEVVMAVAFVITIIRFDFTFEAARYMMLTCLLMGLSLVDFDTYMIPDRFIVSGIIWWAATIPFMEQPWQMQLKSGALGAFAIAGAMLIISLIFDKITGKESLGGGDVKLLFMVGLYLGPWVGLLNLILACIIGIIFVMVMKQKKIPFGPAISLAVFFSILFGQDIVNWYLSLL